jgi:hypothetical protein
MKKPYLLILLVVFSVSNAMATIQLMEPVITDNYIEFVGVNNDGNYRFILNTYEWENDHGPQFQLTVEPINSSQPAFFSQNDLEDPNYWEPMFMNVTQQMAGQAMTIQNNVKRLYLGDVQLLENQFIDYEELHIVGFDLKKDYTLPSGCLLNAGHHMDEMDVKCEGTMTLNPNSLPANKMFVVNVYTQSVYDVWNNYKMDYGCQYTINYQVETPAITSVGIVATYNGEVVNTALPASGFPRQVIDEPASEFYLNRFDATVNVDVDELFMDYAIVKKGTTPNGWSQLYATKVNDGQWVADNLQFNVLEGLEDGETYVLYFDFITGYLDAVGDRLRYDNGGQMYSVEFKYSSLVSVPGDVNGDGTVTAADVTALYDYLLNNDESHLVNGDQTGDGQITAADITAVYTIMLGS